MTQNFPPRLSLPGALLAVLAVFAFIPQSADAARDRGTANSTARSVWCNGNLAACAARGYDVCDERNPTDIDAAELCYEGVVRACNGAFGGASNCRSLPRSAPVRPLPTPRVPPTR